MISSCPRVTILASSREELGVYGEITYQLPTLSLPSSNGQTADSVVRSEAVQLFIERAAAARPGFKLNDANAPAVIKVVRHLDGIPLAIELAAARLKVFSVEQVASRLDQRFQLLTGGSRTLMPRQQTLRALIDWSYDLLDEDEHDLFRRLSVFVGFWTFEAAENIAQPLDAYTLLPQLVSKSLVSFDQEAEPEPRYFYLETIRQYAHDRLVESGGLEDARDRHFAYYESLARSVGFGVGQARRAVEEGQLLLEADNLRAAVEWGSTRFPERTINGIWNLLPLLSVQFPGTISIEWTSKALQRLKSLPAPTAAARQNRERTRMRGMIAISMMKMFIGQLNEARRIAEEVVEQLWVEDCDPFLLAIALYIKAQTGYFLEDPTIEETLARAMNVLQDMEDGPVKAWMLAMVLLLSAETESRKGNTELVEQYLQESTAAVRHANTFFLPWVELSRLLIILQMDLSPEVTKQHFERAIDFLSASQNRRMVAMANSEWAHMMRHRGNFDEALDIYRHMLVEWRELGHRAALANILENIAFVDRVQGRPTQAVALLGAAERIREMIDQDMLRPEREEYEQEMAALRNVVAPSEWDTLWSRGRRLTIDDVIALAIATD
ncbi:MAG: tetratricopeptide repeat protein [Candidatus Promineifilaceae bacterium]|nr:tetratricopeptide repeat protein [Candidatus Promineifilaceae bacterium]